MKDTTSPIHFHDTIYVKEIAINQLDFKGFKKAKIKI